MQRIVISWLIVLAIPVLFASAVYAQTPASDDEPLTWTELEALLDDYPDLHVAYGHSGRLPTRTQALAIIRILESISVDNIPPAPGGVSGTSDAIRRVRRICSAGIWTRVLGRLVLLGGIEHSARMEVQNGQFVGMVSASQDTNFDFQARINIYGLSIYNLRGWSDDPYSRRDGDDGWILGSYVTVRAHIPFIGRRTVMNDQELYCKITSR